MGLGNSMKSTATVEDIKQLRDEYFVELPHFTEQELIDVLNANTNILWTGRQWGWSDSVARDDLSTALEKAYGRDVEGYAKEGESFKVLTDDDYLISDDDITQLRSKYALLLTEFTDWDLVKLLRSDFELLGKIRHYGWDNLEVTKELRGKVIDSLKQKDEDCYYLDSL